MTSVRRCAWIGNCANGSNLRSTVSRPTAPPTSPITCSVRPRVLAVDEPFSGTNTVERIAAAKAVLAALAQGAQVLASTHDSELQVLLAERFDPFHFSEDPGIEGFFDYRLRSGGSTEGNALRLLGAIGFPSTVVADALATAAELGRR